MSTWFLVAVLIAFGLVACIATGRWRYVFRLFAIRPERMTVEKLQLAVKDATDAERVNSILAGFAGGFNAMIREPSTTACHDYCDSLPVFNRPFAEEGVAMGYTLRHLFRFDPKDFEDQLVKQRPEYRYLYYVGLGFWSGMQKHSPEKVARIAGGLDPLHQFLVYDGYGFKTAFFDYRSKPESLRTLDRLKGYGRNAAYQGVGRAFWFLYRDEHNAMIRHMTQFGEFAADAAAGAGLASVFVNPERLEVAQALGRRMPESWQPHFQLGMCFALKARSINHLDQFDLDMSRAAPAVRDAAYASIRECDRMELQIRSDGKEDGYRRWRSRVTAWMVDQVEFPLAGLKHKSPSTKRKPAIPI
ncbi:MAG: DUF1702 family protein [Planctomycetes bacterium]|nr:DUF1702 family protein [Planctomycetota bacterium]